MLTLRGIHARLKLNLLIVLILLLSFFFLIKPFFDLKARHKAHRCSQQGSCPCRHPCAGLGLSAGLSFTYLCIPGLLTDPTYPYPTSFIAASSMVPSEAAVLLCRSLLCFISSNVCTLITHYPNLRPQRRCESHTAPLRPPAASAAHKQEQGQDVFHHAHMRILCRQPVHVLGSSALSQCSQQALGAPAAAPGQEQRCEPSRVLLTFTAEIPSEKHLERLGGQRWLLSPQGCLYHSEIQTQTNTLQILEELKPH